MTNTIYLEQSITETMKYMDEHGHEIPIDLRLKVTRLTTKAAGDVVQISARYHGTITRILTSYFESGGNVTQPRNAFVRAMVEALGSAFDLGWADGGGDKVPDEDAVTWLNARVEAERGYIAMLFQEAKELRADAEFDYFSWVTMRADGYARTVKELYNVGRLRASKDMMVTFDGDDGAESCPDCQKYKGQRHRVSWFVKRNAVPPHGTGLECHRGRRCQHFLMDDEGNQVTV